MIFTIFDAWANLKGHGHDDDDRYGRGHDHDDYDRDDHGRDDHGHGDHDDVDEARRAIARGQALFNSKPIAIQGASGDEIVAMLAEQLGEGDEAAPSYLSPELGPDAIASLFRAAAGLFRAQPWKHVPSDQSVLSVTIEKLALRDAVLSVIGQMGQSLGIVLFSGIEDFEAYLDAADAAELGEEPELPPHFALNLLRAT